MNDMPERLPSRPLRNWFLAWHIHTGDPADVIAKGFDLDPVLVADFLSGEVPLMLHADEAASVCRSIAVAPAWFWSRQPLLHDDETCLANPSEDMPEPLLRALAACSALR